MEGKGPQAAALTAAACLTGLVAACIYKQRKARSSADIVVVGSTNIDLTTYCTDFPQPHETILGDRFVQAFGGKGANQAVMAAMLGSKVSMVTAVGQDTYGKQSLNNFQAKGVDTSYSLVVPDVATGVAPIWVNGNGVNKIIVVKGANSHITPEQVDCAVEIVRQAKLLVTQLEIDPATTLHALRLAHAHGVTTVLNPSPVPQHGLPDSFYECTDIIIPNETEAELLTQVQVSTIEDAIEAGKVLLAKGVKAVVITRGGDETVVVDETGHKVISPPSIPPDQVVDTSGAGDCFLGALVHMLAKHPTRLKELVGLASEIAALSIQKRGTQTSYPDLEAVRDLAADWV